MLTKWVKKFGSLKTSLIAGTSIRIWTISSEAENGIIHLRGYYAMWKSIKGYENYEINKQGEMRNTNTGKTLRKRKYGGYAGYRMYKNGKPKDMRVHRHIMELFAPCENMKELVVNHLDGNPLNSTIDNLEWTTVAGNSRHAVDMGLISIGEDHPMALINEKEALEIIKLQESGMRQCEIVRTNPKFTRSIVGKIMSKERWKHLRTFNDQRKHIL